MKNATLLFVMILAFSITATTEAAVVVFSTEADYNAAAGYQLFFINFNGNPVGGKDVIGSYFSAAVTFGSPEASDPTKVLWNSDAMSDAGSLFAPNFVGPLNGIFTKSVYAFALLFSSSGEAEIVSLYDESNVLIATVIAPNPSGFFGVHSDTPIKSFKIDNGKYWNESAGAYWPDRFFIDDFRANGPPLKIEKELLCVYDEDKDGVIEVGEEADFWLFITITNNSAYTIKDVVVKDRLGGELELDDWYWLTGSLSYYTKGNSDKLFITWDVGDMLPGASENLLLVVSTDTNPGTGNGKKSGKQEYTSTGKHELNSGANVKGMLCDHQVSDTSNSITIEVFEPDDY